jgi:pSer/pThr/pTyr-binding forkhead associated (FHA) protein
VATTLEIIEGPDAGRTVEVSSELIIGRDPAADLMLHDSQVSRRHARISLDAGGLIVEDLGSSNGTFLNGTEIYARTRFDPGDELLVGTTVFQLPAEHAREVSGVLPVPPALAKPAGRPDFVERLVDQPAAPGRSPELESLLDRRVRAQAKLAPLALLALVALIVVIFIATK